MRACGWLPLAGVLCAGWVAQTQGAWDWGQAANFLMQNAGLVGVKVPTAVKFMATYRKSSVLTTLLHTVFGRSLERAGDRLLGRVDLPKTLKLSDLSNDQTQLYDGAVSGLQGLAVTKKGAHYEHDAEVEVAVENYMPVFILPVSFQNLTVFYRYRMGIKAGEATAKIQTHQVALKVRPTFNMTKGCFLRLYDVEFTMWGKSDVNVKSTDKFSLTGGKVSGWFVETFFTDNQVERVVQNVIARGLYYAIPAASKHLCVNPEGSYKERSSNGAAVQPTVTKVPRVGAEPAPKTLPKLAPQKEEERSESKKNAQSQV